VSESKPPKQIDTPPPIKEFKNLKMNGQTKIVLGNYFYIGSSPVIQQ